ncbi:MAG: class I SAM-dependent methyltransferase [Phycisphaerae bacterium]|jgi:ubiquinone/menaquinone biosynthesis C-methylase UbiE
MADTIHYSNRFKDSRRALGYATRFDQGSRRRINDREQRAVRGIFEAMPHCRSVLDVPSGAGRFLTVLTQGGREVTEMDISREILALARQQADSLGLQARFLEGDALRIPLPADSVDAVFCNRLLHHIGSPVDRVAFLREFHRVTRRYLVVSFFDFRSFGTTRTFFKKLAGRRASFAKHPTQAEFADEAAQGGFRLLQVVPTGAFWVAQKYFVLEKTGI